MARRKFKNELTTLPAYQRLVTEVEKLERPTPTQEVQARAGLDGDRSGTLGALKMLEVLGRVRMGRGARKQLCWTSGPRQSERPAELPPLDSFERIRNVLRDHGQTRIATAAVMRAAGLDAENSYDQAAALGALKVLVATGLAGCEKYDRQAITWFWAAARRGFDFKEHPELESLDAPAVDADGNEVPMGDLLTEDTVRRRTRRGGWRVDSTDSTDW